MSLNKQIGIWRGDIAPPTTFHLWIKDDNSIYLKYNDEWLNLTDIIGNATELSGGLMSKEDKEILNKLSEELDNWYEGN